MKYLYKKFETFGGYESYCVVVVNSETGKNHDKGIEILVYSNGEVSLYSQNSTPEDELKEDGYTEITKEKFNEARVQLINFVNDL